MAGGIGMILNTSLANDLLQPNVKSLVGSFDPAGTGILPANSSLVPTWADKTLFANNLTQVTALSQGTYLTNQLNSQGIIRMDGASNFYNGLDIRFATAPNVAVIILQKIRTGGATQQASWGNDTSWSRFMVIAYPGLGPGVSAGAIGTYQAVPEIYVLDTWQLITVKMQNTVTNGSYVKVNGSVVKTYTENQTTSAGTPITYVGAINASTLRSNIDIAFFGIIYDPTDAQITFTEKYVASIYGASFSP